jgi:hypothetical protein
MTVLRSRLTLSMFYTEMTEILNDVLKLGVRIVPSTFEENLDKTNFTPASYVKENARLKALEVFRHPILVFLYTSMMYVCMCAWRGMHACRFVCCTCTLICASQSRTSLIHTANS